MTSRIQKGGPVFRPVARPRPRPIGAPASDSRQPSTAPSSTPARDIEPPLSAPAAHSHTLDENVFSSMPPPAQVPAHAIPSIELSNQQQRRPKNVQISVQLTPLVPTVISTPISILGPPLLQSNTQLSDSSTGISQPQAINLPTSESTSTPPFQYHISQPYLDESAVPTLNFDSYASSIPSTSATLIPTPGSQNLYSVPTFHFEDPASTSVPIIPQEPPVSGATIDIPFATTSKPRTGRQSKKFSAEAAAGQDAQEEGSERPNKGRKRKKKASTDQSVDDDGECDAADEETTNKKQRRGSRGRSKKPSPPPYDLSADPGPPLDATATTMKDLIYDSGHGKVSTHGAEIVGNHTTWKERQRERRARQRAIAEAAKFGRRLDEEEESNNSNTSTLTSNTNMPSTLEDKDDEVIIEHEEQDPDADDGDEEDVDFDYSTYTPSTNVGTRVRVGANGTTVFDDLGAIEEEIDETAHYETIEETDRSKYTNSLSYSKKPPGQRWSGAETELFYDALRRYGENYQLMCYVLPGRTRAACKAKFKAEDKRNPNRINWCLKNPLPYDIDTLSRMTQKDFSGPTPEIRAPAPPATIIQKSAPEPEHSREGSKKPSRRKQSRTPAVEEDGVEVVAAEDYVDDS